MNTCGPNGINRFASEIKGEGIGEGGGGGGRGKGCLVGTYLQTLVIGRRT